MRLPRILVLIIFFIAQGSLDERALEALGLRALAVLREGPPEVRNVANMIWACGRMWELQQAEGGDRAAPGSALRRLEGELKGVAKRRAGEFKAQELSNVLWALAKLQDAGAALLTSLAGAAVTQLRALTPQGLSNIAWSLARRFPTPFLSRLGLCGAHS